MLQNASNHSLIDGLGSHTIPKCATSCPVPCILQCPLKVESEPTLKALAAASHMLVMITGGLDAHRHQVHLLIRHMRSHFSRYRPHSCDALNPPSCARGGTSNSLLVYKDSGLCFTVLESLNAGKDTPATLKGVARPPCICAAMWPACCRST